MGAAILIGLTITYSAIKAQPPKPEDLVGIWIGFDNEELVFTRLDLRRGSTGYCARVSPADTGLHEHGGNIYRVTWWTIDDAKFVIDLKPVTPEAEAISLQGRYSGFSLRLEVGGTKSQWKRELVLYRESRMDAANEKTKRKIAEFESK